MNTLAEVIAEWSDKPFSYGADCCQFAGAVVEAVTGHNPMDVLDYEDEDSATEVIASFGSLKKAMLEILGEPTSIHNLKTGDVVLIKMTNGMEMAGAVVYGRAVVKDHDGIRDLNLAVASMAWST